MSSVTIVSFTDHRIDPRVNRQIRFLRERHRVVAVGTGDAGIDGVQFIRIANPRKSFGQKIGYALKLITRQYESVYWSQKPVIDCLRVLRDVNADLIVANDVDSLPVVLRMARGAKVLFDAHEYAPLEGEDRVTFRVFLKGHRSYLCRRYIPDAQAMMTVGQNIARRYGEEFGCSPVVVTNAPPYEDLEPQLGSGASPLRLVHHGTASPGRRLEILIDAMAYLDDTFELDLMLVESSPRYYSFLKRRARPYSNVRFRPPVPMRDLPRVLNSFDIGVHVLAPNNFNNRNALPNKLFEFIQARLGVVICPFLPEMAQIIERHGIGAVAAEFSPRSLAECIRGLDRRRVHEYKRRADRIARELSAERNKTLLLDLVDGLLGD